MSNVLSSENFGDKLYKKFPLKYQSDDEEQNFALKRYIQSLADGGFKHAIDDVNGLMSLIDPNRADAKVLPLLFKQYGLEVFNGIPDSYLRYLLPRIGGAWSKKGSLSVIEFISSSLSGIKTEATVHYDSKDNPYIDVKFEMDYNMGNYFPDTEQFNRILRNFVPFYCEVVLYYMYTYDEKGKLSGKESTEFKIKSTIEEINFIASDVRQVFTPQTNLTGKLLNSTIVLNESERSIEDPDGVIDTIIIGGERTVMYN